MKPTVKNKVYHKRERDDKYNETQYHQWKSEHKQESNRKEKKIMYHPEVSRAQSPKSCADGGKAYSPGGKQTIPHP